MDSGETVEDVLRDVDGVFGFELERTYKERAHAYLADRRVQRGYDDTAVQCVVRDLVRRAAEASADGSLRSRMVSAATELLDLARDMGA